MPVNFAINETPDASPTRKLFNLEGSLINLYRKKTLKKYPAAIPKSVVMSAK